ncbi:Arginine kinase [Cyphomyrmex costatus]|uniref:Arginine kinase n=1 Tax=Cyphomyrmex costatus TaxID=456900 RepID=A0A151K1M0_9HYME|nr:Arginine kinase [Cyphomyrmex costatus]
MVDIAVLDKLESGFKKLVESDSKSLLKKHLAKEIVDQLKTRKTSFGSALLDVIQSGLENHDSGVGIYAPDAEAYTVFAEILSHHRRLQDDRQLPLKDFGNVDFFGNLDPTGTLYDSGKRD